LVIAISALLLSCPTAFAKDVNEPPAPGSMVADGNAKASLASDLLTDAIKRYGTNGFAEALKHLNTVVQLEPKNITALYYRGLTNRKLGKSDAAKKDFKAATAIKASTAEQYDVRGKAFQECGQTSLADADFAKAKSLKK
jgi:tetratricopeptide (TPR) repeat protein